MPLDETQNNEKQPETEGGLRRAARYLAPAGVLVAGDLAQIGGGLLARAVKSPSQYSRADLQKVHPEVPIRTAPSNRGNAYAYSTDGKYRAVHLKPDASTGTALHEIGHAKIDSAMRDPATGAPTWLGKAKIFGYQDLGRAAHIGGAVGAVANPILDLSSSVRNTAYERKGVMGKVLDTAFSNRAKIIAAAHAPRVLEEAAATVVGAMAGKKTLNIPYRESLSMLPSFGTYVLGAGKGILANHIADKQYKQGKEKYLASKTAASDEQREAPDTEKLTYAERGKRILRHLTPLAATAAGRVGNVGARALYSAVNIKSPYSHSQFNTILPEVPIYEGNASYRHAPAGPYRDILLPRHTSTGTALHEIGHGIFDKTLLRDPTTGVRTRLGRAQALAYGLPARANIVTTTAPFANPMLDLAPGVRSTAYERRGVMGKVLDTALSNRAKIVAAVHAPRLIEEAAASVLGARAGKKALNIPYSQSSTMLPAFLTYATVAGGDILANHIADKYYKQDKEKYLAAKTAAADEERQDKQHLDKAKELLREFSPAAAVIGGSLLSNSIPKVVRAVGARTPSPYSLAQLQQIHPGVPIGTWSSSFAQYRRDPSGQSITVPTDYDTGSVLHEIGHAKIDEALGYDPSTGNSSALNTAYGLGTNGLYRAGAVAGQVGSALNPLLSAVSPKLMENAYERRGLTGKIVDTVLSNRAKAVAVALLPRIAEEAAATVIGARAGKKGLNIPYKDSAGMIPNFSTYLLSSGSNVLGNYLADKQYKKGKELYLSKKTAEKNEETKKDLKELAANVALLALARKGSDVVGKLVGGERPPLSPDQLAAFARQAAIPVVPHSHSVYGVLDTGERIIGVGNDATAATLYHELGHHRIGEALGAQNGQGFTQAEKFINHANSVHDVVSNITPIAPLVRAIVASSPDLMRTAYERRGLTGKILDTYLSNQAKVIAAAILPTIANEVAANILGAREAKRIAGIGYGQFAKEMAGPLSTYVIPSLATMAAAHISDKRHRENRDNYLKAQAQKSASVSAFLSQWGDDILDAGLDAYQFARNQGYVGRRKKQEAPKSPQAFVDSTKPSV